MKQRLFSMLLMAMMSIGLVTAQNLTPPPVGQYMTSKMEKESVRGVPVPKRIPCKIEKSEKDVVKIGFRPANGKYFTSFNYARLKGNVFAPAKKNGEFITPVTSFLVLQAGDVAEYYETEGNTVDDFIVVADKDAKFKALKKAAKGNSGAFDVKGMKAAVAVANTAMAEALAAAKVKQEAENKAKAEAAAAAQQKARAEREAKTKADVAAAAEARMNTDLCAPLKTYIKLIPSNFKSLEGKLDKEETEIEEDNVYFTKEVMPLFYFGRITPTWKEGVKELQFRTKYYRTFAEADAELAFIQSKVDACYKNKNGYSYSLDSKMHFYKSSDVMVTLMRVRDYDSDFNKVYRVLLQVKKR